jgi:colanic acid/amylovoran biosynthesis protein
LLEFKDKVYILRHSFEDLDFCYEIKDLFSNNDDVVLIKDDLNSIELNNIFKNLDYIVGSRYHSVVHAYKNGKPALIIGWAVKYKEIADLFNQGNYCFDIRERFNISKVIDSLELLNNNYLKESKVINKKLKELRKSNVFLELLK